MAGRETESVAETMRAAAERENAEREAARIAAGGDPDDNSLAHAVTDDEEPA